MGLVTMKDSTLWLPGCFQLPGVIEVPELEKGPWRSPVTEPLILRKKGRVISPGKVAQLELESPLIPSPVFFSLHQAAVVSRVTSKTIT